MRLIHLTDLHLASPPDWRQLKGRSHFGKRYLGRLSWSRGRRHSLRETWFVDLVAAVHAAAPDQILVSGDLTQTGTVEEIGQSRRWLEMLGGPDKVTLVPGNHDVYARESWSHLVEHWADYLHLQGGAYPVTRRFGDVLLVALCSAVPTPPLSAAGNLGPAQIENLQAILQQPVGAATFVMLHHPPFPGMIKARKRLTDGDLLERALRPCPPDVVVHGHQHRNRVVKVGGTRVFCTGPASSEDASFRIFDVDTDSSGTQIQADLMQRTPTGFVATESLHWRVSAPAQAR